MRFRVGDIAVHADVVAHGARVVSHRSDMQLVPVHASVLAVVAQHDVAGALVVQGRSHGDEPGLREVGSLQQAGVAAQHLRARISGDALEGRIDVDDGVVGGEIVGDADRVDAGFDRPVAQLQALFRPRNRAQRPIDQKIQQPAGGEDEQPSAQGLQPGDALDLQIEHHRKRNSALDENPESDKQ